MAVIDVSENLVQQDNQNWSPDYHLMNTEFIYRRNKEKKQKNYKIIFFGLTIITIGYGLGILTCSLSNICPKF